MQTVDRILSVVLITVTSSRKFRYVGDMDGRPSIEKNTLAQVLTHLFSHQSSLNETWTLTWHPAVSTLDSYARARKSNKEKSLLNLPTQSSVPDARVQTPRCIQLWFERGNRIRKNDIVEPKLMWRDAFHPHLVSQRKLNESSTSRPYQLCLLTICRPTHQEKSPDWDRGNDQVESYGYEQGPHRQGLPHYMAWVGGESILQG